MEKHAGLVRRAIAKLTDKLGAPWTAKDSLPPCPVCGTPRLPGMVGGVMCMTSSGLPRRPHAVRVTLWGKELAEAARRPKLTLVP
jgi:hypothetical protein